VKRRGDFAVGDTFRAVREVDPYRPIYYAAVSGDFNPIHVDPRVGRAAGFQGAILQGMCTYAWLADLCADYLGDPARLRRLRVRFARPLQVGDVVTFEGCCAAVEGGLVRLEVSARGSLARGRAFPHTLLTGPAGTGKTTVAHALAAGFGRRLVKATGPLLQDVHQLLRLLADLGQGDVLFVEEVHAVPRPVLEALYEAIAERAFSITLCEGVRERAVRFVLPAFTLVAATTEEGDLPTPFLGRFGLRECLGYYAKPVLAALVTEHAKAEGFTLEPGAAVRVAEFARGTPREALRLLDRVLEDAASRNLKRLGGATAAEALARLGYDAQGLAPLEQRYVSLLRGSVVPVPVARLARLLGASVRTLLGEVEPFLFRLGLVDIGPRGRMAAHRPRLVETHALA
jgi:Holliday junction resolvasome RuvABC ATP-dependent DNA helicase subunit